jgi:heme-degrading monooxygenase HmoA
MVLARMSKWNFKKEKRKEAFLELDYLLSTLIHQTEGFRGSMSLLSQDLNSATILTLWADLEALNRSEKEVFSQATEKVKDSLEGPPEIENLMVFRTELFQSSQWPTRWA